MRLEAIASKFKAIPIRLEAIAIRGEMELRSPAGPWTVPSLIGCI